MKTPGNQKGFTLVELMMVVGISTIMMYAMFLALRAGDAHLESADVKMAIQDSAREGLYKMIQEIRMTAPNRVTLAGNCASIQFNVLDPASPVNGGTYTVNWPGHLIQYSRNNSGQIVRTNLTLGQTTVMANDVSSITFTTDTTSPFTCVVGANPNTITVVMAVQRALKNGRLVPGQPLQIAGQARIRNT